MLPPDHIHSGAYSVGYAKSLQQNMIAGGFTLDHAAGSEARVSPPSASSANVASQWVPI